MISKSRETCAPPDKGELEGVSYITYNPILLKYSRQNRKNPTPAEKKMWELLSRKQFADLKFTRQKPLDNFIVDFYCSLLLLVIEIDGDTHGGEYDRYDNKRSGILRKKYAIEVVRYSNDEVMGNIEGVYIDLLMKVEKRRSELFSRNKNPLVRGKPA